MSSPEEIRREIIGELIRHYEDMAEFAENTGIFARTGKVRIGTYREIVEALRPLLERRYHDNYHVGN